MYNYNYTRPHHLLFSFCTVKIPIEVLMMVGFMDRGSSLFFTIESRQISIDESYIAS
jgi:hypothetical protein